jgi:hypothetical protein
MLGRMAGSPASVGALDRKEAPDPFKWRAEAGDGGVAIPLTRWE